MSPTSHIAVAAAVSDSSRSVVPLLRNLRGELPACRDASSSDAADRAVYDATGGDAASGDAAGGDAAGGDAAASGEVTLAVSAVACGSGQWCVESPAIMVGFSGLHGAMSASGPSDIWWAGVSSDSPDDATLVHFNGAQWQRVKPPIPGEFTAVWAQAANSVWVGGWFGSMYAFTGSAQSRGLVNREVSREIHRKTMLLRLRDKRSKERENRQDAGGRQGKKKPNLRPTIGVLGALAVGSQVLSRNR